jgi:hypothetical protein
MTVLFCGKILGQIPLHVSGVLLGVCDWDVNALLEQFSADSSALLRWVIPAHLQSCCCCCYNEASVDSFSPAVVLVSQRVFQSVILRLSVMKPAVFSLSLFQLFSWLHGLEDLNAGIRCMGSDPSVGDSLLCDICFDEKPASEFYSLSCAHAFCTLCWSSHLAGALNSLGNSCVTETLCPAAPACTVHVDENAWKTLAPPVRPLLFHFPLYALTTLTSSL